ncbi:MAG: hypothetical protein ABIF71_09890 [Planctomycetota bacterium]
MKSLLALSVLAALLAAGCGAVATAPLAKDPVILEMTASPSNPIPGRTMVAFVDIASLPAAPGTTHPEVENTFIPAYDVEKETAEISTLAQQLGLFENVLPTKLLLEETIREGAEGGRALAINEAWQRGFDFVLYSQLKKNQVAFTGHTGGHVGNMFLWLLLVVPAWYVHDEIYSASADLEVALIDVYSREDVIRKTYSATTEARLNTFQRGWSFFNVWRGPSSFGPENWSKVAENMTPGMLNTIKSDLLADFKQGVVKAISEKATFRKAVAKTVVVSIGINSYNNSRISPVPYAVEDATQFFKLLGPEPEGGTGKARAGYSKLMLDGQAGKADILDALAELGRRTRSTDTLLVYYCGYGAALTGPDGTVVPALVPYDADIDNLAGTALTFVEIAAALKSVKATDGTAGIEGPVAAAEADGPEVAATIAAAAETETTAVNEATEAAAVTPGTVVTEEPETAVMIEGAETAATTPETAEIEPAPAAVDADGTAGMTEATETAMVTGEPEKTAVTEAAEGWTDAQCPGEIVFILDTSFSSNKMAGKTLRKEGMVTADMIAAALGDHATVFTAGSPGEPAGIFSELRGSLFTYYLLEAVASDKGDTNADGLVTMGEAFLYAGERVKLTSEFRGATQRPVRTGREELQLILKGSDKENAIKAIMGQLGAKNPAEVELD